MMGANRNGENWKISKWYYRTELVAKRTGNTTGAIRQGENRKIKRGYRTGQNQ